MPSTERRTTKARMALGTVTVAACMVAAATAFGAGPGDRLERKIQVMERVIDEVLVQSDHVRVTTQRNTRGLLLDGYGVLFTFDASLAGDVVFGPEGFVTWSSADDDVARFRVGASGGDAAREFKEQRAKTAAERDQRRAGLRSELVDALLDYGPTLSELDAGEWVVVAAFLDEGFGFGPARDAEQLVLKARYGDLRRFLAGELTRQEAAALVQESSR